jgi:hypothetical protein
MAEIDMMMPKEQGIKIKQPEFTMTPSFCHPERSEGSQRLPHGACPERDSEFILSETKELKFLHFVQDSLLSLRMTSSEGLAMTPSFCHPERSEGSQRLPRFARNDKG